MPRYDDNEFLELLECEGWTPAHAIAFVLDCTFQTVNRRLIELAKEGTVEVLDLESGERGIPENETTTRPVISYRLVSEGED